MSEEKNSKYDRQRKTAYISIIVFGAGAVALAYWWMSLSALPKIVIPSNPLPSQNGFDTFARAGTMLQDESKVSYATSKIHTGKDPNDRNYTHAEKEELLTENAPALLLFREGLKQEYMTPSYRSVDTVFPYLANDRKLARLLRLEALVREERGDWKGGMGSHIDTIELGNKVKKGGPLIHFLVGTACEAIGQKGMARLIDPLSNSESKSALGRLMKIDEGAVPFSEVLTEEKYTGQALILEFINKRRTFSELAKSFDDGNQTESNLQAFKYLVGDKKSYLDHYNKYMDQIIANSKHPYSAHLPLPEIPNDPLNQGMIAGGAMGRFSLEITIATNRLLIIGIALKIYKSEHGGYPSKLIELVPSVLPVLPNDPFALSGTFQYRQDKSGYLLYSVGPDGKDDGGTPIEDKTKKFQKGQDPAQRYTPKEESKGDILLGTNVQ